jgi:hypothetical protein
MKKPIMLVLTSCVVFAPFAQQNIDYRKEMIESGEKQEKTIRPENANSESDYESYIRTKAWNARPNNATIFDNTAELDMPNIGGRVRSTLVDEDNGIYLTAPSGGGLWNFATDGSSFSPLDDFAAFMPVTSIAQNPLNKQQVIIGTGDELHGVVGSGIFVSTDAGGSFTQMTATDPATNADFTYVRFVKYSPVTANTIYATSRTKLHRSTDNGASWELVYDGGSGNDIRSIDFLTSTGVVLGVENTGVVTSSTGNSGTFSTETGGVISGDTDVNNVAVASSEGNKDALYAFFEKDNAGRVFKSTNGGTSWTEMTVPTFYIAQGWFTHAIGVHPTDPNIVVLGSYSCGYSTDGGVTWLDANFEVDYHDIHFHSSNPDVAYIGYDQGLGKLDFGNTELAWVHNGVEWVQELQFVQDEIGKNPGFNASQIYFGDYYPEAYGDDYIFGQQDGGSFAEVNGGHRRVLVGDGGSMFINKQDPTKSFGCTQYGNLKFSSNALEANNFGYTQVGASIQGDYPNFITQFAANNADGSQMYIPSNTAIQRTLDDGTSFSSIATHALSGVKIATEEAVDPVVYAIGYNSDWPREHDLIRIDAAASSPSVTTKTSLFDYYGGYPDQIMVDPNDRNSVFITTTNGGAYKVSDLDGSSYTMTDIKGDAADVNFNVIIGVAGVPGLLFAGTNVGLFYSEDGGTTWIMTNEVPHTQVTDLRYRESDKRLFIFTYGRGAWATDYAPVSAGINEQTLVDYSVYPNPTAGELNIQLDDNFEATLFDQAGSVVLTSSESQLSLEGLTSGMYMLHIKTTQGLVATEKIIVE